MKPHFIVVSKNGEIHDASEFLKQENISNEFRILLEQEVGGKSPGESERSEYAKYAKKFGFGWEKHADIGFMSMDYKAHFMHRLVKEYARKIVHNIGFPIYEVSGSRMFDMAHPVVHAYADLYGERLFQPSMGKKKMVLGYDCSYPQFHLASGYHMEEKQFPFAHFSINECYRLEQSGECMLFYRGRQFNMPDLHPYFKDIYQAFAWFPHIEKQVMQVMEDVKRKYVIHVVCSSGKYWEQYQQEVLQIAKRNNQEILVEVPIEDKHAYWVLNVDYKIIDAFKQAREIACIQIDVENAKRMSISYKDMKGQEKSPVIIHSAVSGGIERYLYMIFDQFKVFFPLWLAPVQIRLIPINEQFNAVCIQLAEKYKDWVRIDIDDRSESVSKRVKRAKEAYIPHIIVLGHQEEGNMQRIEKEIQAHMQEDSKPFLPIEWPLLVSKQVQ